MTSCPIISIVSELRHAHCCMSRYQSNSRSCVGTTRVGVKVQMTQFIGSLLSLSLLLYELWYQMKSPNVSLNYRIVRLIFTKLGRDKVLMTPHICIDFWAKSAQGWIQGRAKIGQGGGPLIQRTSSSDWKATATNRIHSNYLEAFGKKCCYFWFHWEVKFLTCFDVFLDLVILCILMQFL